MTNKTDPFGSPVNKLSGDKAAPHPIKVLFLFRRDRARRLRAVRAGKEPDEMLYGVHRFDAARFSTTFIEGDTGFSFLRLIWAPFEHQICRRVGMGFVLDLSISNLRLLRSADVVISTVDACGLPVLMLKKHGWLKTKLLFISQGLAHRIEGIHGNKAREGIRSRYSGYLDYADRLLVLGEGAATGISRTFGVPHEKVHCLPFGVDADFWTPAMTEQKDGGFILSVGSDGSRDYATLLQAAGPEPIRLVTRLLQAGTRLPAITIGSQFSDLELRNLYRTCRFVVTPLHNVDQPSGQSVTLQAMACGKAVILTKTCGLWAERQMIHNDNCYFVPPGDVQALRQAIKHLWSRPEEALRLGTNACQTVRNHFTSATFAERLEHQVSALMKGSSRPRKPQS
jgi:glycosyltransferase involved in cell wall biosynthesis